MLTLEKLLDDWKPGNVKTCIWSCTLLGTQLLPGAVPWPATVKIPACLTLQKRIPDGKPDSVKGAYGSVPSRIVYGGLNFSTENPNNFPKANSENPSSIFIKSLATNEGVDFTVGDGDKSGSGKCCANVALPPPQVVSGLLPRQPLTSTKHYTLWSDFFYLPLTEWQMHPNVHPFILLICKLS